MTHKTTTRIAHSILFCGLAFLALFFLTVVMSYAAGVSVLGQAAALPPGRQAMSSAQHGATAVVASGEYTTYLPVLLARLISPRCPVTGQWQGEYWNNTSLGGEPVLCRDDANVAFNWGGGSPDSLLPVDGFSARWTRTITFGAGRHIFHLAGDDGVRLWVDSTRLIDAWQIQALTEYTGSLDLIAGPHTIRVEYYEEAGNAGVSFWWEDPAGACSGARAEYYNGISLASPPTFRRCEGWVIDYDWGTVGPGGGLGGTGYSVRWSGQVYLLAGAYVFTGRSDDGMRVWLDGSPIIDAWIDRPPTTNTRTVMLNEGAHSLRVEYYQATGAAMAQFAWERREAPRGVVISQKHGFDMCQFPTPAQLQVWWDRSPYWEVNFYLGGISRFCSQPNLTAQTIQAVHAQGWNFMPTWVGPQAPCTKYAHRMSIDPGSAYNDGRAEAEAAAAAAGALGLPALAGPGGTTEIYYDLEPFNGNIACNNTVSSFISGWVGRLHELGLRAGLYGHPCFSNMPEWAALSNPPDDIWPGLYTFNSYDERASVWGINCLPDTLWTEHQRIYQYAGGHNENWGEVTLNIDSNVLDGHVAGNNQRPISPTLPAGVAVPAAPAATQESQAETGVVTGAIAPEGAVPVRVEGAGAGESVQQAGLLPSGQGWAVAGKRLLWSADGGDTWADITPGVARAASIRSAYFLDVDHGWLLLDLAGDGPLVSHTVNGGRTWSTRPLAGPNPFDAAGAPAYFAFVDSQTGWLALKLPSSSNFSRGALFGTHDGGQTWTRLALPIGGPVRFVDQATGWAAGGAAGDELYVTRDGGETWQRQSPVSGAAGSSLYYALPDFLDPKNGTLAVTIANAQNSRVEIYRTGDGGQTWEYAASLRLDSSAPPGSALPAASRSPSEWALADPGSGRLWTGSPAGPSLAAPGAASAQLKGVTTLQLAAGGRAWALVQTGQCSGSKEASAAALAPFACTSRQVLLRTSDGGRTWSPVNP